MSKKPIVAGNWKLNKGPAETQEFLQELIKAVAPEDQNCFVVFPPAASWDRAHQILSSRQISWGGQNVYAQNSGAYTGENSAAVLKALGAKYCLVGHSERRQIFKEDNELLAEKVNTVLNEGLISILCVGETLEQRESDETEKVLEEQLKSGLSQVNFGAKFWIAYEPVWAIGTGKVASPGQAQRAHSFIRSFLEKKFGSQEAASTPLLYGGSVKPENAAALFTEEDIDGFLVGGASLQVESFVGILRACL